MSTEYNLGFDYSHKNKFIIEDPAFNDFIEFLFNSDLKLGKIEEGITYEKLSRYNVFIIGVPMAEAFLELNEINDLVQYVKDGGSLLILNDKGGDKANKNNLSELSSNFGIKFNSDQLFDNENFSTDNFRPVIKNFKKHFLTREINQIVHSGGCTLEIIENLEDKDLDVTAVAFSSEDSAWHKYLSEGQWFDEPVKKFVIIAAARYSLGKVVAIGNLSLFSSFHEIYGIHAADNFKLIANLVSWLMNKAHSKEAQLAQPFYTTIPIDQDLYYWIKEKLDEARWKNIQEVINFALKVVKFRMKQQIQEE
ncbi:MAG: hypothetical protein ACFFEO_04515 [Candidatus Thorarchaeota archaeon]